jgi:hypothetical protein
LRRFAELWLRLDEARDETARIALLASYFRATPPDDAAWALWLLAGNRAGPPFPSARLRDWVRAASALPEWMLEECRRATGDLAETAARVLDEPATPRDWPLHRLLEERRVALDGLDPEALQASVIATWRELPAGQRLVWNRLLVGPLRPRPDADTLARGLAAASGGDAELLRWRLAGEWQPTASSLGALLGPRRAGEPEPAGPPPPEASPSGAAERTALLVLLYAQRSEGGRGALYGELTFAAPDGDVLVPVARVAGGLADAEATELDRWVRRNAVERYGPVRQVRPELVFEVAFVAAEPSARHKAGLVLSAARVLRWRRDLPATEATPLAGLRELARTPR